MRAANLRQWLKNMMSPSSEFRGRQKEALWAIVSGQSLDVVVMPTGGGKSLLFMLPAWVPEAGMTIVVVPLIALQDDLMRRCRKLHIRSTTQADLHIHTQSQQKALILFIQY